MASSAAQSHLRASEPEPHQSGQRTSNASQKHRVVLESVTQEKKKLRTVFSFEAKPPKGFTFIPAGNPELTNALKDAARLGNHEIHVVSTTPHQHDLSRQVHRIGFHFPSVVVAQVCALYGIVLTAAGTLLTENEFDSFRTRSDRRPNQTQNDKKKDQITINTEARQTIRDLFPNIPDDDLNQIIKTAFQKGQRKVGTANELSLIRRAQLAVVAYIRHRYTDYDKLLRLTQYKDARNIVEKPTLRKLVQWRGDDENGKRVLEDVFREVVVISDDDGSEDEYDDDDVLNDVRDVSVEIVSSKKMADHYSPDPVGDEQPRSNRPLTMTQLPRKKPAYSKKNNNRPNRKARANEQDRIKRRGFSRYQAWNEALAEYRAHPGDMNPPEDRAVTYSAPEELSHKPDIDMDRTRTGMDRAPHVNWEAGNPSDHSHRMDYEPSNTFRAADGTLFARVVEESSPISYKEPLRSPAYPAPVSRTEMAGRSDRPVQTAHRQQLRASLDGDVNGIVPSIESPQIAMLSPSRRQVSTRHAVGLTRDRPRSSFVDLSRDSVEGVEIIDMTHDAQQISKRRRFEAQKSDIRNSNFIGLDNPTTSSQPKERVYISLISPPDDQTDPMQLDSRPPQYIRDYGQQVIRSNILHRESFPSLAPSHRVDRQVNGFQALSTSDTSQLYSQPVTYVSERPSQRDGKISSSHRAQSSLSNPTSPIDRGIQEYRAFRARERQVEKAMQRSSAQPTYLMEVDQGSAPVALGSRQGHMAQLDRSQLPQKALERPTSLRIEQHYQTIDDPEPLKQREDYRLLRNRDVQPLPRRRSASPSERAHHNAPRPSLESHARYFPQSEQPRRFIQLDGTGNAHRFVERPEQVLVQPTRRLEAEDAIGPRYVRVGWNPEGPRSAGFPHSQTRL